MKAHPDDSDHGDEVDAAKRAQQQPEVRQVVQQQQQQRSSQQADPEEGVPLPDHTPTH